MATKTKQHVEVGGREISLSNLDKVLWPRDGYTKGDLISYYAKVSAYILPHLRERPLTLQRYPDGIDGGSFFEKQKPRFTPSWIPSHADSAYSKTRTVEYILCNDEATLLWCANLAAIVLHVWYSHAKTADKPDFALFDLDPGEKCTLKTLASAATVFHDVLEGIGAKPLVKTSGGSGLHVIVPLEPRYEYDAVKDFAEVVARHVEREIPELTTLERTIAKRPQDRVYLDWVQVGKGKTVVPAYSPRARDGAPVSMPLDWDEVDEFARKRVRDPAKHFAQWNIETAFKRLDAEGDLWDPDRWKRAKLESLVKKAASNRK